MVIADGGIGEQVGTINGEPGGVNVGGISIASDAKEVTVNGVSGRVVDIPISVIHAALDVPDNESMFSYTIWDSDRRVLGLWLYHPAD